MSQHEYLRFNCHNVPPSYTVTSAGKTVRKSTYGNGQRPIHMREHVFVQYISTRPTRDHGAPLTAGYYKIFTRALDIQSFAFFSEQGQYTLTISFLQFH